ncbi:hypothetical protein FRB95_008609 [Tulasnella sp. JGI-2019a]|nr:hypothetical protein FRB95_008609 [Tulasnella sp. JGI-2019a]
MTQIEPKVDILIIGATGYTGRLILRYLASHPNRDAFTLAIAGRSLPKLKEVAQSENAGDKTTLRQIDDITDEVQVRSLIVDVRVVISAVGPFWRYGKALVGACAEFGVHYVDTTGETAFIKYCIDRYDFLATKTGAIIINSAGFDSVPSDLSSFLSVQTLKQALGKDTQAGKSTSAVKMSHSSPSGGTMSTIMDAISGEMPKSALDKLKDGWLLSPIKSVPIQKPRLVDHLPLTPIVGSFFLMGPGNAHLVRRSWGLHQMEAVQNPKEYGSEAYGDEFEYHEFLEAKSWIGAFFASLMLISSLGLLFIPPIRWFARNYILSKSGEGPSEEVLQNGWFKTTNVTLAASTSSGQPVRAAKTTIKGTGEVGYLGTSVMTSEIALALLPTWYPRLTRMAKQGGVLTPTAALGMVLKERLENSGRFKIESEMMDTTGLADRKDR